MDKPGLAPLPHEWMLVSIIGFLVSAMEVYPDLSKTWGFTFMIFFAIMFIASVVSMSNAGLSEEELVELAVHHEKVRRGEHRKQKTG
jgi:hypothetical protein